MSHLHLSSYLFLFLFSRHDLQGLTGVEWQGRFSFHHLCCNKIPYLLNCYDLGALLMNKKNVEWFAPRKIDVSVFGTSHNCVTNLAAKPMKHNIQPDRTTVKFADQQAHARAHTHAQGIQPTLYLPYIRMCNLFKSSTLTRGILSHIYVIPPIPLSQDRLISQPAIIWANCLLS